MEEGTSVRVSGVPFRAFGPYWAEEISGVLNGDHFVVFGGPGVSRIALDDLRGGAGEIVAAIGDGVSPEKREADEAEVMQATQVLTDFTATSLVETARHLATTTARSLSCEFGAVLLSGPPVRLVMADEGWHPTATQEEIVAALMPLTQVATNDIYVEQDVSTSRSPIDRSRSRMDS